MIEITIIHQDGSCDEYYVKNSKSLKVFKESFKMCKMIISDKMKKKDISRHSQLFDVV